MKSNDKFSTQDRLLVIKELEKIQETVPETVKLSRKFFKDNENRFYCLFGGREDWHGISSALIKSARIFQDKTRIICRNR